MSELNLIKTVLFNAANLNEALTRLTELGIKFINYDGTPTYHIHSHKVVFWQAVHGLWPIGVCIDNALCDYQERFPFLAGQCETVETPVPAASPETTGQRPTYLEVSFDRSGNLVQTIYPKLSQVRHTIREERRLKNSRVKGLSS